MTDFLFFQLYYSPRWKDSFFSKNFGQKWLTNSNFKKLKTLFSLQIIIIKKKSIEWICENFENFVKLSSSKNLSHQRLSQIQRNRRFVDSQPAHVWPNKRELQQVLKSPNIQIALRILIAHLRVQSGATLFFSIFSVLFIFFIIFVSSTVGKYQRSKRTCESQERYQKSRLYEPILYFFFIRIKKKRFNEFSALLKKWSFFDVHCCIIFQQWSFWLLSTKPIIPSTWKRRFI